MAATPAEQSRWRVLKPCNSDSEVLLKTNFGGKNSGYEVMLFDGLKFWQENASEEDFKMKCKKYNPKVEADLVYVLQQINHQCSSNQAGTQFSLIEGDGGNCCILHLKFKLQADVPFIWQFELSSGADGTLSRELMLPLFSMVRELQKRQEDLFHVIAKKDVEIQDYKDQGMKTSRRNIDTEPFDQTTFKKDAVESKELCSAVEKPMDMFLTEDCQTLYRQILHAGYKINRERTNADEDNETIHAQEPTTQLMRMEEIHAYPADAVLQPTPFHSNGRELMRREVIEKRLAEHNEKASRKQKKSKIKL